MSAKNKTIELLKGLKIHNDAHCLQTKAITKEIKESYEECIVNCKIEMLQRIAHDYNLDYTEMVNKYVKNKKLCELSNLYDEQDDIKKKEILESANLYYGDLLTIIRYDDEEYFVELKENGKVYNKYRICVGHFSDNNVMLDVELIKKLNETHMDNYDINIFLDPKNNVLMSEYVAYSLDKLQHGTI